MRRHCLRSRILQRKPALANDENRLSFPGLQASCEKVNWSRDEEEEEVRDPGPGKRVDGMAIFAAGLASERTAGNSLGGLQRP